MPSVSQSVSQSVCPGPLAPLAIMVRESWAIQGLEEKLSLHADDTLLNLNDAGPSLMAALEMFYVFGTFLVPFWELESAGLNLSSSL